MKARNSCLEISSKPFSVYLVGNNVRSILLKPILVLIAMMLVISNTVAQTSTPNILVLVADDLGTESLSSYGIGSPTAVTPNLDKLAKAGVRFEGFWSQPSCSPTRAAVMTGRYAFRTGVHRALSFQWGLMDTPTPVMPASANKELYYGGGGLKATGESHVNQDRGPDFKPSPGPSRDEVMLPTIIKSLPGGYATAAVGKWHLADLKNGGLNHPNDSGFDYFSGLLFGGPGAFSAWRHLENGKLTAESGYIDRRSSTDALRWINKQGARPWFLWFSFINPHVPVHKPPSDLLHSTAKDLDPNLTGDNNQPYFFAQVEAMDTLIGSVLDGIPKDVLDNTYVIFLGDNGTAGIDQPPAPRVRGRLKGSVYEGGVNVPFIVIGPNIKGGRVVRPLGHVVDLFATIIELAGGDADQLVTKNRPIDSVSFAQHLFEDNLPSKRSWVMTESSRNTAIRDENYKLLFVKGEEEFYHLVSDPNELHPLVLGKLTSAAQTSYSALKQQANKLLALKN